VHPARLQWYKRFSFSRERIVDLDFLHGSYAVPFDSPANV
jgi:hypothetical protein